MPEPLNTKHNADRSNAIYEKLIFLFVLMIRSDHGLMFFLD